MSEIECAWLNKKLCPRWHSTLIEGPRGGASQNMYCSNREGCRHGFNVCRAAGQIVFSEGIGEIDDARYTMYLRRGDHG